MAGGDLGAAVVAVGVHQGLQLFADHPGQALLVAEDLLQFGDFVQHALVVFDQLVLLQGGQPVQAELQNGLRLLLGQVVGAVAQAVFLAKPLRAAGFGAGPLQQRLHVAGAPAAPHQGGARLGCGLRAADEVDDRIDVGQRHRLPLQQVAALPGAAQQMQGAPGDHLPAVLQERLQHLL